MVLRLLTAVVVGPHLSAAAAAGGGGWVRWCVERASPSTLPGCEWPLRRAARQGQPSPALSLQHGWGGGGGGGVRWCVCVCVCRGGGLKSIDMIDSGFSALYNE